jgi:hypothetical protein
MERFPLWRGALLLILVGLATAPAMADIGVLVHRNGEVYSFDPSSDTLLPGMVDIYTTGSYTTIGDVEIMPDESIAFATRYSPGEIWVIDLASMTLAGGINPIDPGITVEDISLTPDGKYLLACDGGGRYPVKSIDVETRSEVDSWSSGYDVNSVEACDDGVTVLCTSVRYDLVYKLNIDAAGQLTDTGLTFDPYYTNPNNSYPAPGSESGIVCIRATSNELESFTTGTMAGVDRVSLSGYYNICGAFSPDGGRVYVRTAYGSSSYGDASVSGFNFDATTGAIGSQLFSPISVGSKSTYYGFDQLAVTGEKIYVPERGAVVNIYDAETGAYMYQIDTNAGGTYDGDITGIKIRGGGAIKVDIDIKPKNRNNPINIDNNGWGQVVIAILSSEEFDALEVDPETIFVEDAPVAERGNSGRRKAYANHDVNQDGLMDLVIHIRRKMTGATRGIDTWKLEGETYGGERIWGKDMVWYVPSH